MTMYGSCETDPLVRYYDETLAVTGSDDIGWYVAQAARFGGPVLDLACGTGRIAIALARRGYRVTALDASEGMLARFRRKLATEPNVVQGRIEIRHAPMVAYALGRRYRTIICCDAFFHNLTVEDEVRCLRTAVAHLRAEGHFLFNLPKPTCAYIQAAETTRPGQYGPARRYPLDAGQGSITVERCSRGNAEAQTVETSLRFVVYDACDRAIETSFSSWRTRYLYRWEAVHLLHRCGLAVEALYGAYDERSVEDGGQLILVACLADAPAPETSAATR